MPVYPPGTEQDAQPPILVNIGDLLSHWTQGLFVSTLHRVVVPGPAAHAQVAEAEARYSMAYFCHPVGATVLEPVPSKRVEGEGEGRVVGKGQVLTADEHLLSRLQTTYSGLYVDV